MKSDGLRGYRQREMRYSSGVESIFFRKRLFTTRYLYGRKKQTPNV